MTPSEEHLLGTDSPLGSWAEQCLSSPILLPLHPHSQRLLRGAELVLVAEDLVSDSVGRGEAAAIQCFAGAKLFH